MAVSSVNVTLDAGEGAQVVYTAAADGIALRISVRQPCWFGGSNVGLGNGFPLSPGQILEVTLKNTEVLYGRAASNVTPATVRLLIQGA